MSLLSLAAVVLALAGVAQCWASALLLRRHMARLRDAPAKSEDRGPNGSPGVTVLKPLHGDEPLLEDALATLCAQDYPALQIIFGVQSPADPACAVVRRLMARYPDRDMTLVIDERRHGANRKVGNLINMLPRARHDVLMIADSDVHAPAGYVRSMADALAAPGIGLVTALYTAIPSNAGWVARLGALQITQTFLPNVLLGRALGRRDCLGASMMLRRETLERLGGLAALADHLADDNALGRLVRGLNLDVALASTIPATTVPETALRPLLRHELRWARTIRALVPVSFAFSAMQYPTAWAALAAALAPAPGSLALLAFALSARVGAAWCVTAALRPHLGGLATPPAYGLLIARDVISLVVMAASYAGRSVDWRGHAMVADGPAKPVQLVPAAARRGRFAAQAAPVLADDVDEPELEVVRS